MVKGKEKKMKRKSIYDDLSPEAQKALGKALSTQAGIQGKKKSDKKPTKGKSK